MVFSVAGEVDLVEGNGEGLLALHMADATVCELVHVDFHLSEYFLDFANDFFDNFRFSCEFEVVNVLAHDACELASIMSIAKLRIDSAGDKAALVLCDPRQLHGEGSGCIDQARSWFVAMEDLFVWVEVFET